MNKNSWNVIDTGVRSAEENMALDAEFLEGLDDHSLPILHFYDWKRESATFGYFVKPSDYLNLKAAREKGLDLARRPTGGGIVFHIWDLAFSILIPAHHPHFSENTLENYAFVNRAVLRSVRNFLSDRPHLELIENDAAAFDPSCRRFCMAQPTKYDVVLKGRKIAGASQRKTKKGFLHQGTIALKVPSEEYLNAILLPGTKVLEAMQANTFALLSEDEDLDEGRRAMKRELEFQLTEEKEYVI
jgi:lipoate---protein ligase